MVQRKSVDRRCSTTRRKFPLRDSSGKRVREERRKLSDRRIDGIGFEIEWPDKMSNQAIPQSAGRHGQDSGFHLGKKY
jgi:hypothetical protein